jgi:hypothetical protein
MNYFDDYWRGWYQLLLYFNVYIKRVGVKSSDRFTCASLKLMGRSSVGPNFFITTPLK